MRDDDHVRKAPWQRRVWREGRHRKDKWSSTIKYIQRKGDATLQEADAEHVAANFVRERHEVWNIQPAQIVANRMVHDCWEYARLCVCFSQVDFGDGQWSRKHACRTPLQTEGSQWVGGVVSACASGFGSGFGLGFDIFLDILPTLQNINHLFENCPLITIQGVSVNWIFSDI